MSGAIGGGGVVILLFGILALIRCSSTEKRKTFEELEFDILDGASEAPSRFSYKELEVATNNFSEKLGQGGFGAVFKGVLCTGQQVAVKRLESSLQGEKQFRAEVSTVNASTDLLSQTVCYLCKVLLNLFLHLLFYQRVVSLVDSSSKDLL